MATKAIKMDAVSMVVGIATGVVVLAVLDYYNYWDMGIFGIRRR